MRSKTSQEVRRGVRDKTAGSGGPGVRAMRRATAARAGAVAAASFLVTAVAVTVLSVAPAPVGAVARVTTLSAATAAGAPAVKVPSTPVGKQLDWLLGIGPRLPLSTKEISAHFDAALLAQVSPAALNQALESLGPPGSATILLGLSKVETSSLVALVQIGPSRYSVQLGLDGAGLIASLFFKPAASSVPHSWSEVDKQLTTIAPEVSFLAAKVGSDGTCSPLHSVLAGTPRPLGSMFKLFILGAIANAVHDHRISWSQKVTITAAVKVGGSGTLQNSPDGTELAVEQVAIKMISVSDNTAADLLLKLVGRLAVEAQVRAWSSHASLDIPFLTVNEMFALKYHDFPTMANHYLSLNASQRASYLATTVDKVPASAEQSASMPRDINSIEWFASAADLCRAFTGLAKLQAEPALSPIGTVLSTNNGGIALGASTWPRVWFKGGSEPGVLSLGYLARDSRGQTFVVVVLTEDTSKPVQESAAVEIQALDVISGALGLMG